MIVVKRARVIYNPTSGREVFRKHLPDVLARLEQAGYETSCHATTGQGDAKRAAEHACDAKFDVVIAAGGDGTLNEVVNGLAEKPYRPRLGLIPVGTTNDYARAVGIPRTIMDAVEIIAEGHHVPVDIGKFNDTYFVNIAAVGRITEVSYEVPSRLKTVLGQLAYYIKGIEMLPKLKPTPVSISYDGKTFNGEAMLVLVANTNSVGGFEKLAPDATINDGLFNLVILEKTSVPEFIRLASDALRGDHLAHPKIIYTQAKEIHISTPNEEVHINIDGEDGGILPGLFLNLYRHIDMFVPVSIQDIKTTLDE